MCNLFALKSNQLHTKSFFIFLSDKGCAIDLHIGEIDFSLNDLEKPVTFHAPFHTPFHLNFLFQLDNYSWYFCITLPCFKEVL